MTNMKKIFLLAIAMVFAVSAFSQDRQRGNRVPRKEMNPEAMALAQTKSLQEALQLDSVQYQAVFLMNYSDAMAMQESMKARMERGERVQMSEEERKASREVMQKRAEVRNEQMKQILSEEQYEKYLEYMKKSKSGGRSMRGGRGGRSPRGGSMQ